MPNSASAFKRIKSDAKRRERNQVALSEIKTIKRVFQLTLSKDPNKAPEVGTRLIRRIDKAAVKGIIPKGRASRIKSRVALALSRRGTGSSK